MGSVLADDIHVLLQGIAWFGRTAAIHGLGRAAAVIV
jgi:hypothetical protein